MADDDKPSLRDVAISPLARLQAACAASTPASLLPAHMSLPCAGRLYAATVDGVIVEIENPPTLDFSLVGCAAAVRFPVGQHVAGFVEPIAKELPMEYALELNKHIEMSMEGSVG